MSTTHAGATPAEWDRFAALCGEDLLPVVSNTKRPISPNSNLKELGKVPSMLYSTGAGGIKDWPQHKATPAIINQWKKEPDYGICIITRLIRAIDVDIPDPDRSREVRDVIEAIVGPLPARTRSNSGKLLLAFELAGELPKRVIRGQAGIVELLGTGQQFIAAGLHSSGEARYEWLGGLPGRIPVLTLEELELVWAELTRRYAIEPTVTEKTSTRNEVKAAALANDPVAMYLINKTDRVREIDTKTLAMLIRCPNSAEHTGDSGDTETVYYPANTGGFAHGGFKCMHAHCQNITMPMFKSMIGYSDDEVLAAFDNMPTNPPAPTSGTEVGTPAKNDPYPLLSITEYLNRPQPSWHIKHVLPKAELVLIYGASGSGKSFFALDLAFAIDRGGLWHKHAVNKGRVAYVVAEGSGSFRNRLQAYCTEHQLDPNGVDIVFMPAAPNLMNKDVALELAKALVARGQFAVIIIDTFAQVTPGANENSGDDMGTALLHCRGIHRYTHATIVLIHHAGKDATKGARGWSGTHAAADCVIEVVREENRRCATIVKQKDGRDGVDYSFTLQDVVVAHDEDGEAITSCVLQYTDEGRPVKTKGQRPLGEKQKHIIATLEEDLVGLGLPWEELIDKAVDKFGTDTRTPEQIAADKPRDRRREYAKDSANTLITSGRIVSEQGRIKLN